MSTPDCECFKTDPAGSEQLMYDISCSIAQKVESACQKNGVCSEAYYHLMLTIVTMLMRTAAGHESGNILDCNEQFESLLHALPDDIRVRDQQLDAYLERNTRGGLTS